MNPSQCSTIYLNVINNLVVSGSQGSDFGSSVQCGKTVPANGGQLIIAKFPPKGGNNRWDWVYLTDSVTGYIYQIYIQVTDEGTPYAFFGNYDSSEEIVG